MQFQFTPLREGRPHIRFRRRNEHLISIHAPPRGATEKLAQAYYDSLISIHAPPRGATPPLSTSLYTIVFQFTPLREGRLFSEQQYPLSWHFNSRPSARGDSRGVKCIVCSQQISIHAPPRGATGAGATATYQRDVFQFTPLREGRRYCKSCFRASSNISIHAPPRGATRYRAWMGEEALEISIHAPPRGATYGYQQ